MIWRRRKKAELSYILYEATERCNLDCIFCYNHWKRDGYIHNQPAGDYTNSLKTLQKLFSIANIKHITFTGGEPMLAERIGELILFCRMKGASVSLITNGNHASFEELSQLINLGVQLFELPVHAADAKTHDHMTKVQGSWEKSLATIKHLSRMGAYIVPVMVITKFNYNQVAETLEMIHSMGLNRVMLNRYNIGGKGVKTPEEISATQNQLNEAFAQANEKARTLKITVSSNVCTPHCVVNPRHYPAIQFTNCSPDITHRPLTLNTLGDLRFCNHSPTVLGNIFTNTVDEIFANGQKNACVDQRPDYCSACNLYEKCLGGCRAAAEQSGNTFCEVDPIVFLTSKKNTLKDTYHEPV